MSAAEDWPEEGWAGEDWAGETAEDGTGPASPERYGDGTSGTTTAAAPPIRADRDAAAPATDEERAEPADGAAPRTRPTAPAERDEPRAPAARDGEESAPEAPAADPEEGRVEEVSSATATPAACGPTRNKPSANAAAPTREPSLRDDISGFFR